MCLLLFFFIIFFFPGPDEAKDENPKAKVGINNS